jgi:peptidoglycan/LPS O-acetylase OafA/YrhL
VLEFSDISDWGIRVCCPLIANLDIFIAGMLANWLVPMARNWTKGLGIGAGLWIMGALYIWASYVYARAVFGPAATEWHKFAYEWGPTLGALFAVAAIVIFECSALQQTPMNKTSRMILASTQMAGAITYAFYVWHEPLFTAQAKNIVGPIFAGQYVYRERPVSGFC